MRKLVLIFSFLCSLGCFAQTGKWVEKAKRAVFSVITYDNDGKILNTGNGFFVSQTGIALSDYALFDGAERAVVITADGKEMPVDKILGADEMYDVIKFQVAITEKKVPMLAISAQENPVGTKVYLLPYSTQKNRISTEGLITKVDKMSGNYYYYTFSLGLKDKMVSCPIVTEEGKVVAVSQMAVGSESDSICYGVDVQFAMDKKIEALSFADGTYGKIGIRKGLPKKEEDALLFLMISSPQLSHADYMDLLNEFVLQFPKSSEGYVRRAVAWTQNAKPENSELFKNADSDYENALKLAADKGNVFYAKARQIYNYRLENQEVSYKAWTYEHALEEVNNALKQDTLPLYYQLKGDIYFALQNYAEALVCYERVNRSNIASSASFYSAAKTKQLLHDDGKEVVALLDSCLAKCAKPLTEADAAYLLERAQANMDIKQPRAALADYDAYFKVVRGNVNDLFYYYREQAALGAKQFQRALDDMAKAIQLNPNDITYKAELAVVNLRVGRKDEAIRLLEETVKIAPEYAEGYRLLGFCYVQMNQKEKACNLFNKAKELGDKNVEVLIEKYCK